MRISPTAAILAFAMIAPRLAFAADYAPIVCAKADSPAQLAICRSYALGQAEARMATLFAISMSLVAMGQHGDIGEAQVRWLKTREACGGDIACLTAAYDARIAALKRVVDDVASRGPY